MPVIDGKGRWVQEDLTFGYGLNIPRTRHASEILKTTVLNDDIWILDPIIIFAISTHVKLMPLRTPSPKLWSTRSLYLEDMPGEFI